MKMLPHEVLQKLGFHIPPEGVEVSPDDAYLNNAALEMAGKSINISTIPDGDFKGLHDRSPRAVENARGMTEAVLHGTFKLKRALAPRIA